MAPLAEIAPVEPPARGFRCAVRGYDLGDMHFSTARLDAMTYRRTTAHVRQSPLDHWCITVLRKGEDVSTSGKRSLRTASGDVKITSLAQELEGCCSSSNGMFLYLARDRFPDLADLLDAATHTRLTGFMSPVLKECLLALDKHIRTTTLAELPTVVASLAQVVAASLRPNADKLRAANRTIAAGRFSQAQKLVEDNLASPELEPAWLCRTMGVSRRQLYYLFEPHGGVSKYILRRRLAACCKAIADQSDTRLISTVAYAYGFTDPGLFSRQFLAEFGFRPSEARSAGLAGHLPRARAPMTFSDWLTQVQDENATRLVA